MNEAIKALIQAGGAIGALGFVWLIVKALVPAFSKHHEGNGLKAKVENLEKEVAILREWRHDINNDAQRMVITEYVRAMKKDFQ